MFDDVDEMLECPVCHTSQAWEECLLGQLGSRIHFRCVGCGSQWSESDEEEQSCNTE